MKKVLFALFATVLVSQTTLASSVGPTKIFAAVSQLRKDSVNNEKVLSLAERDAAEFTFSDGTLRGEDLKRALNLIRRERPRLQASDMDLAIAILQAN
ncbi:DUF2388 domain-containing protein [Bdellovibrio sp. HCB337]|uniref:DUF2388 domain-containing protein n=1 Tax=Bdellovibrio sp. HCB337 TaxID=3394358 RepID=UPI0039A6D7E1